MMQVAASLQNEIWAQPVSFITHFQAMTGPHGLYQHATKQVPLLREGYCTDDNARAIQVLVRLRPLVAPENDAIIERLLTAAWQFILEAKRPDGRCYNFRTADGQWLEHDVSDDMYARLIRTAVTVIEHDAQATRQQQARDWLAELLPQVSRLTAPRAWAEANIALAELSESLARTLGVQRVLEQNTNQLLHLWRSATSQWPWFESKLTYANALLPHGLLAAYRVLGTPELVSAITDSTQFLITSTIREGMFIPIGSVGWYPQGGQPSTENQQPIEAGTMTDLLADYAKAFPGSLPLDVLMAPYLWFFGANTGQVVLANPAIGASYDGLFAKGPNENYGAESMLAYLWAEIRLRDFPEHVWQAALAHREKVLTVS